MSDDLLKELRQFEDETEQCMKCGFCSFVCPVYQEERIESSVARGKNELIKGLLAGELELNSELADRLYKCASCGACTESCPAKAHIPRLIVAARADMARNKGVKFPYGFVYRNLLPNRRLFGNLLKVSSLAQSVFMPKTNGTLRHLPNFMSGISHGRQIPSIARKFLRRQVPVVNKPPGGLKSELRIGYFPGCMNEYVTPHLGKKTIEFLTRRSVEVVLPKGQGCCGAPVFLGGGDFETGRKIADSNVAAFESFDYVVTDCATCACAFEEYHRFLADTPERQEAYTRFLAKIRHITQFITDILELPASAYQAAAEIKGKKLTWHDPCHLNRHLGITKQPRQMLQSLDDAQYVEMPDAGRCCGMAGQFNLLYYELSRKIAEKKIDSIDASGADIVVTSCPGCEFQLLDNITRLRRPQKVMTLMEVLE
ncbi:MAG: (Fe-S)-binding protein [Acidobacteria bacterium]|nr:(Fe-S)-binding protein [Acidobacteriota bacterium]